MKDLVSNAIARNAFLEIIEQMAVNLRLSLMREAFEAQAAELKIALKSESDEEDSLLLYERDELGFGVLVGYFDECWWAGLALLSKDKAAPTNELAPSVQEHLRKKGVDVALKSEHYAFVELCANEEFSEFLPQVLESFKANASLLKKLNDALIDFKAS